MIRFMYIVEDEQGKRTAHEGMRSAKFHAFQRKLTGKLWRVSVAMPSGRKLYAALYNQADESLTDWTLVNLLEKGQLRKPPKPPAS